MIVTHAWHAWSGSLHLLCRNCALENIFQNSSLLFLYLPPAPRPSSVHTSCLFLKPCGTRPVCPSLEVWERMAVSWRQTVQKPCMPTTPPSDTPALLWSHQDCPENQKHLPCLSDKHTHTITCPCITHTEWYIQIKNIKCKFSDTPNTHFDTLEYTDTQAGPIVSSCCYHRPVLRGDDNNNNNCGANSSEMWPSHLPAAFNIFLKSQHRLWAVNKPDRLRWRCEKRCQSKVRDTSWKTTKLFCYLSYHQWTMLANGAIPLTNALL